MQHSLITVIDDKSSLSIIKNISAANVANKVQKRNNNIVMLVRQIGEELNAEDEKCHSNDAVLSDFLMLLSDKAGKILRTPRGTWRTRVKKPLCIPTVQLVFVLCSLFRFSCNVKIIAHKKSPNLSKGACLIPIAIGVGTDLAPIRPGRTVPWSWRIT